MAGFASVKRARRAHSAAGLLHLGRPMLPSKKFILFGGGTFQNITMDIRRRLNYGSDGVFMNDARVGSAFSLLGVYEEKNPAARRVIIKELNGRAIKNLDDFIEAALGISHGT